MLYETFTFINPILYMMETKNLLLLFEFSYVVLYLSSIEIDDTKISER